MSMHTEQHKARYPLPARAVPKLTPIDRADEVVDIRDILKQMNVWAPDGMFYSYKIHCPWDYEHADAGRDKNCRIFGSTNIYCWAMHGYITPTTLYARWKHVTRAMAADLLLEERGLTKRPWRETWNDLIALRDSEPHAVLGSKQDVVSALHYILQSDAMYVQQEFSLEVRTKWESILSALDKLWSLPDIGITELEVFYDKSLTALQKAASLASETA